MMLDDWSTVSLEQSRARASLAAGLVARADDGFWTPGMGESTLQKSAVTALAAVVPVYNPKAGSPAPDAAPIFTVTSVIKVVRPVNVTEVVVVEPIVTSVVTDAPPASTTAAPPASSTTPKVFGGTSSTPYIRLAGATSSAPTAAAPPRSSSGISATAGTQAASPLSASSSGEVARAGSISTTESVFAIPTQSQIRAVIESSSVISQLSLSTSLADAGDRTSSMASVTEDQPSSTASLSTGQPSSAESATVAADPHSISVGGSNLGSEEGRTNVASSTLAGGTTSRSTNLAGLPEVTGSSSVFSHIGDSPANIALTIFVCLAILATLLALPVFCLCRRRLRRRRERLGHRSLGSYDGVSGSNEEGWPTPLPDARSPAAVASRWSPSGELGDEIRQMRELWREATYEGPSEASTPAEFGDTQHTETTSEWTSFVGGHASTDEHDSVGWFNSAHRRGSDSTVTPEILERRRMAGPPLAGAFLGHPLRAPHPLRVSNRPEDFWSPTTVSPPSRPISPRTPAEHVQGVLASPFAKGGSPASRITVTPARSVARTGPAPMWRESLDRVMNAAADLISTTHLARDSDDGYSRRGSLTRPFAGLRRILAINTLSDAEKQGPKGLSDTTDDKANDEDEKTGFDWCSAYPGPRAPFVGSSVASSVAADLERPVSPPSPILGYIPAVGAMATVVPPRPAHVRAASSASFYGVRPTAVRGTSALPRAVEEAETDSLAPSRLSWQNGSTSFLSSPEVPPRTPPTPEAAPMLAAVQASPAPFSRLDPAVLLSEAPSGPAVHSSPLTTPVENPFADPLPPSESRSSLAAAWSTTTRVPSPLASISVGSSRPDDEEEEEESLSQLAHHAAFAQLHLLQRREARRSLNSSPASLRTRFDCGEAALTMRRDGSRPTSMAEYRSPSALPAVVDHIDASLDRTPTPDAHVVEDEAVRTDEEDDEVSSLALSSSSSASVAHRPNSAATSNLGLVTEIGGNERESPRRGVMLEAAALLRARQRYSLQLPGGTDRRIPSERRASSIGAARVRARDTSEERSERERTT